jgi:hypothetical protein
MGLALSIKPGSMHIIEREYFKKGTDGIFSKHMLKEINNKLLIFILIK